MTRLAAVRRRAELPTGPPWPALIQGLGHWCRPLAYTERLRARYGKRFTVRLPGTPPFVFHSEPEHIKEIFTAPPELLHPGYGSRVLEPLVGRNSVLLLDGGAHMRQRKLMLPAFHGERMAGLEDLVREVAQAEVEGWSPGATARLHPRMQSLTLEIILRAVFGMEPGRRLDTMRDALTKLLAYSESALGLLPPPDDPAALERNMKLLNRAGPMKGWLDWRDRTDDLIAEQIDERRREESREPDDVLAMLLEARHEDGSPLSDLELRDELMTLLAAGHETTASSLAWAFAQLSRNPGALATLQSEVASGDDGPYLLATIYETLRHRPVLPNAMPRFVRKPVRVGGWDYEPGTSLIASAYLVHHDEDVYPEPYVFRPERFVDTKPGTYSWIPFGGGRRRCLGSGLAILEMRVVLATVLRSFEISGAGGGPEVARRRNITVSPSLGARVALEHRAAVPA